MTTPLDLEIRSQLGRVIAGETSLREFYRWFVPSTWEVELTGNQEAIGLTHGISHLLNERSSGDLSSAEAKSLLKRLADTYVLVTAPWNHVFDSSPATGTSSEITVEPLQPLGSVFGRPHEVVPAR